MDKRSYLIINKSKKPIKLTELNLLLPLGISNLFELNPNLDYNQIDYSIRQGMLRSLMDDGVCSLYIDQVSFRSYSDDIVIRPSIPIQVFQNRVRSTIITETESKVFDDEDVNLFKEEEIKPARQLEEELKKAAENVQAIEATIKEANLPEKPIENRYTPPIIKEEERQKIKNDVAQGYNTCSGINKTDGKNCTRRAKNGQKYCGFHKDQYQLY